jgi:hypothetical protein
MTAQSMSTPIEPYSWGLPVVITNRGWQPNEGLGTEEVRALPVE